MTNEACIHTHYLVIHLKPHCHWCWRVSPTRHGPAIAFGGTNIIWELDFTLPSCIWSPWIEGCFFMQIQLRPIDPVLCSVVPVSLSIRQYVCFVLGMVDWFCWLIMMQYHGGRNVFDVGVGCKFCVFWGVDGVLGHEFGATIDDWWIRWIEQEMLVATSNTKYHYFPWGERFDIIKNKYCVRRNNKMFMGWGFDVLNIGAENWKNCNRRQK